MHAKKTAFGVPVVVVVALSCSAPTLLAEDTSSSLALGPLESKVQLAPGWTLVGVREIKEVLKKEFIEEEPLWAIQSPEGAIITATYKNFADFYFTADQIASSVPGIITGDWGIKQRDIVNVTRELKSGLRAAVLRVEGLGSGRDFVTRRDRRTVAIWVDVPLLYKEQGVIKSALVSLYYRSDAAAARSGEPIFGTLIDGLVPREDLLPASHAEFRAATGKVARDERKEEERGGPGTAAAVARPTDPSDASSLARVLLTGAGSVLGPPETVASLGEAARANPDSILGDVAAALRDRQRLERDRTLRQRVFEAIAGDKDQAAKLLVVSLALKAAARRGDNEAAADIAGVAIKEKWSLGDLDQPSLVEMLNSLRDNPNFLPKLPGELSSFMDLGIKAVTTMTEKWLRDQGIELVDLERKATRVGGTSVKWIRVAPDLTDQTILKNQDKLGILHHLDPRKPKLGFEFTEFKSAVEVARAVGASRRVASSLDSRTSLR